MIKKTWGLPGIILFITISVISISYSSAEIITTGDVDPFDPLNWNSYTTAYIGKSIHGTMEIIGGSEVTGGFNYVGYYSNSSGSATVEGAGSIWRNSFLHVGQEGDGVLNIKNGGTVTSDTARIGELSTAMGTVTVTGKDSHWINPWSFRVGEEGDGVLHILDGGKVSSGYSSIGRSLSSNSIVTVGGFGSRWINEFSLDVGDNGSGTLNIKDGGLVSVAGTLTIDDNQDGDSYIYMSTFAKLALYGQVDNSITNFLGIIEGTDAINYWNEDISDWANITAAEYGTDYTLQYITDGELAGYTVLTIPEPVTISIFILGGLYLFNRKLK